MGRVALVKKPPAWSHNPFKDLRPLAKPAVAKGSPAARPAAPAPTPVANRDLEDQRYFERAMTGVQRLSEASRRRHILPPTAPPAPPPARGKSPGSPLMSAAAAGDASLGDLIQDRGRFTLDERGDSVSGLAPGINRRLLKRLRAGDYPVQAEADLHGQTRDKAAAALERFLAEARTAGKRCVLVIHGRGLNSGAAGPVLKTAAKEWLSAGRTSRHVLAFTSAPPAQGGDGALLVLLRAPSEK